MKRLSASASSTVNASNEQCIALLAAVDRYPDWYPDVVRHVVVVERDQAAHPSLVHARLHVARGPLARELELALKVTAGEREVKLERLPNEPGDREEFRLRWRLEPGRLALDIDAHLDVPAFLPVGGIGQELADGFLEAARARLL